MALDGARRNAIATLFDGAFERFKVAIEKIRKLLQVRLYDPYHIHEGKQRGLTRGRVGALEWLNHVCSVDDDMGVHTISPEISRELRRFRGHLL